RRADVVLKDPAVNELDLTCGQGEKSLCSGLGGGGSSSRHRHVGRAVRLDADMDSRARHGPFVKGDVASPERMHTKRRVDLVYDDKRLGSRGLLAMNHQALDAGSQGEPVNRDGVNVRLAARGRFKPANQDALDEGIPGTTAEENDDPQQGQRG